MKNAPPHLSIKVRNAQRRRRVDLRALQKFCECALASVRKTVPTSIAQIDILLVSDARIAALHKRFMQIPGPTDVITFQHGEIFISVETASRNARRFKTSASEEIRLYLVHGLLHLLGYDDKDAAKARVMEAEQARIVAAAAAAV